MRKIAFVLLLLFSGCMNLHVTDFSQYMLAVGKTVVVGMSTSEVENILGLPTKVQVYSQANVMGNYTMAVYVIWKYGDLKMGDSEELQISFSSGSVVKIYHSVKKD